MQNLFQFSEDLIKFIEKQAQYIPYQSKIMLIDTLQCNAIIKPNCTSIDCSYDNYKRRMFI